MTEYLKTKEDIALVRAALSTARSLESEEKKLAEMVPEFRSVSQELMDKLGMELWHTEANGGKFFWRCKDQESIQYDGRVSALRALLDETIEWK